MRGGGGGEGRGRGAGGEQEDRCKAWAKKERGSACSGAVLDVRSVSPLRMRSWGV